MLISVPRRRRGSSSFSPRGSSSSSSSFSPRGGFSSCRGVFLLTLFITLPSILSALYIARLDYIPVELLDEFSDGRATVSRDKRKAAELSESDYNDRLASPAEMDFLERAFKSKMRQQLADEENRRDREELAQRWDSLKQSIENNMLLLSGAEDGAADSARLAQNDEAQGQEQAEIFVPSSMGMPADDDESELEPVAIVFDDNGQRPAPKRQNAEGEEEQIVVLEL